MFEELESKVEEALKTRLQYKKVDFSPTLQYCHMKHDETLCLFLEMEKFLEDNIKLFVNPEDTYVHRADVQYKGQKNNHNSVLIFDEKDRDILTVWLDQGIYFLFNKRSEKVVFISNNVGQGVCELNTSEHYKSYNFFDRGDLVFGYERFFPSDKFIATMKKKFDGSYEDYQRLVRCVDEDWDIASKTKECLIAAVGRILEEDKAHLQEMVEFNAKLV